MRRPSNKMRQQGFTLLELLTALGIFLLVCGAAFTLLGSSQQRYRTESQVLTSFQEARLALDQIVRDVNDSGFPPATFNGGNARFYASAPFAWSKGASYPATPCQIVTGGGGNCTTASGDMAPGDFDLIIETNPNPLDPVCAPNCPVQWIRYQLNVNNDTLYRGIAPKIVNDDPDSDTAGQLVPFVQNVENGVLGVPIFTYTCDALAGPQAQPLPCTAPAANNSPRSIRDVKITLIVQTPQPDATTGQPRRVELSGRGRRVNPNQ